jgi:hypothetical protein
MFNLFKKGKPKSKRMAGVYLHSGQLLLHAQRRAQAGFCVSALPVVKLSATCQAEEVGRCLRQVLAAFQDNLTDPEDWQALRTQFLQATGFKSWKALESTARSCWIEEAEPQITFTPLRNGGTRGDSKGFQPNQELPVSVPCHCSDEQLGKALLQALSLCE